MKISFNINIFICFLISLANISSTFSQVTIGSDEYPLSGSILDLKEKEGLENSQKGVLLPRVTLKNIFQLEPCTTTTIENKELHSGLIVYNLSDTYPLTKGVYMWDGQMWKSLLAGPAPWYSIDTKQPAIANTSPSYLNAAVGVGTDIINEGINLKINGNSILNGNVVVRGTNFDNTSNIEYSMDIDGTLQLSSKELTTHTESFYNEIRNVTENYSPLILDNTTGKITYPGYINKIVGGFRPGLNTSDPQIIKNFPTTNTLATIEFVCYVSKSSAENNAESLAYASGSFFIIGLDSNNPIRFKKVVLKDHQGNNKNFTINTEGTSISWNNGTQLNNTLEINQTTGDLIFKPATFTFTYVFDILGGI